VISVRLCSFAVLILSALVATCSSSQAQQSTKIWKIGFLSETKQTNNAEPFLEALRKLGYSEGKNIQIVHRYAGRNPEQFPELANELVRLNVDVIFAPGTAVALAAKTATTTIPIVFATVSDAVGSSLVASLARPGGNLTGLTQISPDLAGKRLEILKETVAGLSRVALLLNRKAAANAPSLAEMETAARQLAIQLQVVHVDSANDLDQAFSQMSNKRAGALIVISSPMFLDEAQRIADLAKKHRLPGIYTANEYIYAGGLMNYGVSIRDLFRRAAPYIDKILKGAKPSDLPVEQPTKFEFIINLKAAKQIGLTIPPNILARADRVIR